MNNQYDPTNPGGSKPWTGNTQASERGFMTRVFNWMFLGLLSTSVVSFLVVTNPLIIKTLYSNSWLMIVLGIGLLILVFNISANITKMSPAAAAANFFIYSSLNGVLMSSVLLVYTTASVFKCFLIAALMFGVMALYGAITKQDLSKIGSIAFMALIGLIIAQVVNMFLHNSAFDLMLSYAAVLIFVVLTAYDVQRIKEIGSSAGYHPNMAIVGALALYLDFINIFIYLLRIMGVRRDD